MAACLHGGSGPCFPLVPLCSFPGLLTAAENNGCLVNTIKKADCSPAQTPCCVLTMRWLGRRVHACPRHPGQSCCFLMDLKPWMQGMGRR